MTTVVHFIGSLDRGGAEMVALEVCRTVPSSEFSQVFFCLSGRRGTLGDDFEAAGATVVAMGLRPALTFVPRLVRALRSFAPSVVVSHVSLASGWILCVCKLLGIKVRLARMHSDGDDHGNAPARGMYRSVSRLMLALSATHIVGVTQSSLSFAVGRNSVLYRLLGRKRLVVPNGVDTFKFRPEAKETGSLPDQVLYVGRASPEKNRRLLMPIWKELAARGFSGTMSIVGSNETGDLGDEIPSTIRILGDRSDVDELLRGSVILILTSLREGLPTVVLEALASGVPVVSSDLPGLREIQGSCPGVTTVPVGAPPAEWATAIVEAVNAGATYRVAVREGFLKSPYSLDESIRAWGKLWRS